MVEHPLVKNLPSFLLSKQTNDKWCMASVSKQAIACRTKVTASYASTARTESINPTLIDDEHALLEADTHMPQFRNN